MLLADCATTRYSIADPAGFAGNTAHARRLRSGHRRVGADPQETCPALVAVHGASDGWVTGLELQAAVTSDRQTITHRRFALRFSSVTSPARTSAVRKQWVPPLVNTNHRHDQGSGRPPIPGRPPGLLARAPAPSRACDISPSQPCRARTGVTLDAGRPIADRGQADEPETDQQQDPRPQLRQRPSRNPPRQGEERHEHRQRCAFQLATQALALHGREFWR